MPKLLKNAALTHDTWVRLRPVSELSTTESTVNSETVTGKNALQTLPSGNILFPLTYWLEHRNDLLERPDSGLWLNSDDDPEPLSKDIYERPCIAVNFPVFTDGRGFSLAHLLRTRYNYPGELRAVGNITVDQLYYLKRCGFDTYQLNDNDINDNTAIDTALRSLNSFSVQYQADI